MPFNSLAPLTALDALVSALPGMEETYISPPMSFVAKLVAYSALAGQDLNDKTSGQLIQRDARYRTTFAYAVDQDAAAAEVALCAVVDACIRAIYTARPAWAADPTLGSIRSVNAALADDPVYVLHAGAEYREWPIEITVHQEWTVGT